jgi:plastocyanin
MKKMFFILALSLAPLTNPLAESKSPANHTVVMKSISYDPKSITVELGDTVEWENKSYTDHSAQDFTKGGFDTGSIAPGKSSKAIPFKKIGTYTYHCRVHGKTMSGVINVVGSE